MYVSVSCLVCCLVFFFFKQKTAYEMRISDWSSDVCSSDLPHLEALRVLAMRLAGHAFYSREGVDHQIFSPAVILAVRELLADHGAIPASTRVMFNDDREEIEHEI